MASVANYVEQILRLKKRDLEAAEHVKKDDLRSRDLVERNSGETWMSSQLSIRNPDEDMITRGQRAKKDCTPK